MNHIKLEGFYENGIPIRSLTEDELNEYLPIGTYVIYDYNENKRLYGKIIEYDIHKKDGVIKTSHILIEIGNERYCVAHIGHIKIDRQRIREENIKKVIGEEN